MTFDRQIIEARLSLNLIGSSDMPKLAWDALEAGRDGPGTRRLAALNSPTYFEVRDVLPRAPLKHTREFEWLWIHAGYPRELASVGNLDDDIYIANGGPVGRSNPQMVIERLKKLICAEEP